MARRAFLPPAGRVMLLGVLAAIGLGARQPFELSVDGSPQLAGSARRIESIPVQSLAMPLSRAGLDLPQRVHVLLLANDDPRARATPSWVAGRAVGTDLVVIFPQRIGSYPYRSLESVVLHEIVHLALNARAGGRPLPRWFHEGVAVSVESGWGVGAQVQLLLAAARDPGIDDVAALFASDRVPETSTAYLLSTALVEDVRRRHGAAVPGAIAGRVGRGEPFDRAFLLETGSTVSEAAARAWRVYRGVRWLPVLAGSSAIWTGILLLASIAFIVRLRRRRTKRWEDEPEDDDAARDTTGEDAPREERP